MHPIVKALLPSAVIRYSVDGHIRHYHNLDHALYVLESLDELVDDVPVHLAVAALYHDAVYVPGAGSDANELCSSAALEIDWKNINAGSDSILIQAQRLIRNTDVCTHLMLQKADGDLAVLLDADLHSLAASWEVFVENQHNIIRENRGELVDANFIRCGEFLQEFLTTRQYIYHTDTARAKWEAVARANITRWCTQYKIQLSTTT
jgi:predicted metal-dependent HD superfamily phosphohydrolase